MMQQINNNFTLQEISSETGVSLTIIKQWLGASQLV